MAAVTCAEMRAAEARAFAAGWTEEALLDLAGRRLGIAIGRQFPQAGTAVGFLGKGHNAADTLVALRMLRERFGWKVVIRSAHAPDQCAPLVAKKWRELAAGRSAASEDFHAWEADRPLVLLDGLVGIGGKGGLRGELRRLADEMRGLRERFGARVAAVDLPSGVDADSGEATDGCVTADFTFTIGAAKRGLLLGHAADHVGALVLVPVEPLSTAAGGDLEMICCQTLDACKSPRPFDFHKGRAGRVALIAGSERYPGAAALAALGALRGGAGLVTLHAPRAAVAAIAANCPAEVILRGFGDVSELEAISCDALVLGCGLGSPDPETGKVLLRMMSTSKVPTVIDADGLNLVARCGGLGDFKSHHVLTPHPGEFARLAPDLAGLPRERAATAFAGRTAAVLLLKGGRTIVTQGGGTLWCNSTGNPGMASGGQGDLLAGVIGALLAASCPPWEAAAVAAWLCGRAAEIAIHGHGGGMPAGESEESLTATVVAQNLGRAFLDWRTSQR